MLISFGQQKNPFFGALLLLVLLLLDQVRSWWKSQTRRFIIVSDQTCFVHVLNLVEEEGELSGDGAV